VAEDFNEAVPPMDPTSVAASAWLDRLFAHASATGRLERVSHPPGARVVVHSPDGREVVVVAGEPMVAVDPGGRAYLLVVAD
jgi:quercetin dioxygenase-like cupin family protein